MLLFGSFFIPLLSAGAGAPTSSSQGNAGAGENYWTRELKFEAVPRCFQKSEYWGDTFWDGVSRKCVHLNRSNQTVPYSWPCPPGSGRREDEFVCRGRIETAFQIHCKHAWDVVPSKPYYANEDYQCMQILVYSPMRQFRCPANFKLKKLYDRTGFRLQYHKFICVSHSVRAAHLVTFDPLIVSNCQYLKDPPRLKPEDLRVSDDDVEELDLSDERRFVHESYHNHDHLRDPITDKIPTYGTGGVNARGRATAKQMGQCSMTKTEQLVICDYTDKLVWNDERDQWDCVGKVYVSPDDDPTGCKSGYYWSNEFLACIHIQAYSPERYCADGIEGHPFEREGSPRRYSRGPRYNDQTLTDSNAAFDDFREEDDDPATLNGATSAYENSTIPSSSPTTTPPVASSNTERTTTKAPTGRRAGPLESPIVFEQNGRCYTDTALPDTPYCPEGYFLEQYHREAAPTCIQAEYSEPMWDCKGIGDESAPIPDNEEMICTTSWDGRHEVAVPPPPTKREYKNTLHLSRKSTMNLPLYEEAADMKDQFSFGKDVHNAGKISWDSAIKAALQLLNPQDTFSPYSAPLTTDGGLVFSGLQSAQVATS